MQAATTEVRQLRAGLGERDAQLAEKEETLLQEMRAALQHAEVGGMVGMGGWVGRRAHGLWQVGAEGFEQA